MRNSSPADEWHFCSHYIHELDIGIERQAGDVEHCIGDVLHIEPRLRNYIAVGLQGSHGKAGAHLCCSVADVDLAAGYVVRAAIERDAPREARDGMLR